MTHGVDFPGEKVKKKERAGDDGEVWSLENGEKIMELPIRWSRVGRTWRGCPVFATMISSWQWDMQEGL